MIVRRKCENCKPSQPSIFNRFSTVFFQKFHHLLIRPRGNFRLAAIEAVPSFGNRQKFVRDSARRKFPDKFARFEAASCGGTFTRGVGLPGRVWSTLRPVWIPDVTRDNNFPRGPVAAAEGLHAALAFPICGEKFLGIMEFFSDEIREPDKAMLAMFGVIGGQIGQFIERKRAEEALQEAQAELKEHATKLERVVAQRTARLRETVEDLEAFSYSIAHDMRAPLRSMQGFAGILKQDYSDKLDDTAQGYLQRLGEDLSDGKIGNQAPFTFFALGDLLFQSLEVLLRAPPGAAP